MPRKPASKPAGVVIEDARLAKIAKAFAAEKRVSVGKLFASVGLKVDGKIFAMVVKGRLVVKLPKERVDALVASGAAERFDPGHGRLMREWASFGEGGPAWLSLAREAHAFVGGA
jgi:TfoX/Sxy family transcriptional regulator of competence genes